MSRNPDCQGCDFNIMSVGIFFQNLGSVQNLGVMGNRDPVHIVIPTIKQHIKNFQVKGFRNIVVSHYLDFAYLE